MSIDWCRNQLEDVRFEPIDAAPPTAFADGTFELIFGHSVFTPLAEPLQFDWLADLDRILAPGGLCLVTIMSELSWFSRFKYVRSPHQLAS